VRNGPQFILGFLGLTLLTSICVSEHGSSVALALGHEIPRPKDPPEPTEASLLVVDLGASIKIAGSVPSSADHEAIRTAVSEAYPNRAIEDALVVEESAKARSWIRPASRWIPLLSLVRDGELVATGETVRISGTLEGNKDAIVGRMRSEAAKATIIDGIKVRTRSEQVQDTINSFLDAHVVEFEVSSAQLTPQSEQTLKEFAKILRKEGRSLAVEIEGHTDNSGMIVANRALSKDRAERVRDVLSAEGHDATKIVTRGYGSERPIADNSTEEGRKKNRRIEIHLR
jgi:OmpA-OmpF porin, OOP family